MNLQDHLMKQYWRKKIGGGKKVTAEENKGRKAAPKKEKVEPSKGSGGSGIFVGSDPVEIKDIKPGDVISIPESGSASGTEPIEIKMEKMADMIKQLQVSNPTIPPRPGPPKKEEDFEAEFGIGCGASNSDDDKKNEITNFDDSLLCHRVSETKNYD